MATMKELDPLNQSPSMQPFLPPNQLGEEAIRRSSNLYWRKTETRRVMDAQRLWAWYFNVREEILRYIRRAMHPLFKLETLARLNIRTLNIVARVIGKLALNYKDPPKRQLDGGLRNEVKPAADGEAPEIITVQSSDDKIFQDLIRESSYNRKAKEWHRLGKLFNTVLVQPVWRPDKTKSAGGWIDFIVHTPAWCSVKEDPSDFLRASAFWYPTWSSVNGVLQQTLIFWSETDHYLIDALGNKIAPDQNPGMENPYNRLPAVVLRFSEGIDFWGEGMWELVDGNEEVATQFSNLMYVAILQGHGQAVAINMNLPASVQIGPDRPIVVEKAAGSTELAPPSFTFENPSAPIQEIRDMIDWMVKTIQATKGLSPASFAVETSIASGVSKMMDSVDIQEMRADDTAVLQDFELRLFEVVRTVWNYHASSQKISEKAIFSIEFAEPKVVKTTDEKTKERESKLKLGTASRVDFIMEDNPGMSREDATKKLEQIIAEERKFEDKFGLLGALDAEDAAGKTPPQGGGGAPQDPEDPEDPSAVTPPQGGQAEPPAGNNPKPPRRPVGR